MTTDQPRVALVTGAASGNGKAIAERLLSVGMHVVAVDRDGAALERGFADRSGSTPVVADVADERSVAAALADVENTFGRLDLVVNNAGIVRFGEFPDLTVAEWQEVFEVNSTGPFIVSKAAFELLGKTAANTGATTSIVNITSIEAHIVISSSGLPQVHYNASKGALVMLTKALAVACASAGVRVNAVAPGFIETPFTTKALQNEQTRAWLLERTPLGRVGQPEDVAGAVAFLGSDDADFITGTTVFVDGGWTAL